MAAHSNVVGGSTAKRVLACPGSVALVQKMPPQPSSVHADTGTLLHNTIASILETGKPPHEFLGATYNAIELTEDLLGASCCRRSPPSTRSTPTRRWNTPSSRWSVLATLCLACSAPLILWAGLATVACCWIGSSATASR